MMYKCVIEFEIKLNGGVLHGVLYLNYIVHIQKKKIRKILRRITETDGKRQIKK